ncbi:MAG TPA: 3-hydroxyacyl-CoA dehydrogenase family protein [Thermoanaerobaculia bacterium]|nr:3-hydroxyacyl-CoA dehydrogenase family protein [Thermoanaerobaculia bacterium]
MLVVGGGTMGRGIAGVCALAGFETAVFEAQAQAREKLRGTIEASWEKAVERGRASAESVEEAKRRLRVLENLEDGKQASLAIEAIPELLEAKKETFLVLDRLLPDAVLASNTSSLSIAALASATGRPDRVIGIHFFNPVAAMPLVEIVSGKATSARTREAAAQFVAAIGKQAIHVADSPGFATSRLGLALGLEAMRMVEEGVATAGDIDRAMELGYGHRMGPLKTTDLVGLDVRLAIAEALSSGLNEERFRPPEILRRMVAEGKTGRKSGEGFYRWEGDKPVEK